VSPVLEEKLLMHEVIIVATVARAAIPSWYAMLRVTGRAGLKALAGVKGWAPASSSSDSAVAGSKGVG